MDNLSEGMKARLEKWRQLTGKTPDPTHLGKVSPTKVLSKRAASLGEYRTVEQDYWNLELENERLKRKK